MFGKASKLKRKIVPLPRTAWLIIAIVFSCVAVLAAGNSISSRSALAASTQQPKNISYALPPRSSSASAPLETGTPCSQPGTYTITPGTDILIPGTTDIRNNCDDCVTVITLPFSFQLYDQTFITATVSSNGNMQFVSSDSSNANTCGLVASMSYAIFADWDDLSTRPRSAYGMFTGVIGVAPNRTFLVEWRANSPIGNTSNFEILLHENQTQFDIVYGLVTDLGISATVGVQQNSSTGLYTQYSCNSPSLIEGLKLTFSQVVCPTGTPTSVPTDTPTGMPTNTATQVPTDTPTPAETNTPTDTPSDTPTFTPSDTPTNTPTGTRTPTETPTDTPTGTNTSTETPTGAATSTPRPTEAVVTPTGTVQSTATNTR